VISTTVSRKALCPAIGRDSGSDRRGLARPQPVAHVDPVQTGAYPGRGHPNGVPTPTWSKLASTDSFALGPGRPAIDPNEWTYSVRDGWFTPRADGGQR